MATVVTVSLALFVGLGLAVRSQPVQGFDKYIRDTIHTRSSPLGNRVMLAATDLGSTPVVTAISFLAVFGFLVFKRNRVALLLALNMAVAIFLDSLLKDIFHRPRPDPFFGILAPHSFSYPSGHSFFTFCCYGMLTALLVAGIRTRLARVAVLLLGVLLIVAVGLSRVYLGVHYPSDVLGGWLLGLTWIGLLLASERKFDKRGVSESGP